MALILVVEPDGRQTDALASLLTGRLDAELVQARSAADGVGRLSGRVPDLILTASLLSPKDDAVLAGHLRDLGRAAAHVQTLTIPVLETSRPGRPSGGVLAKLRRSRDNAAAPDGCDPRLFADEVALYLARAAEERQAVSDHAASSEPGGTQPDDPAATMDPVAEAVATEAAIGEPGLAATGVADVLTTPRAADLPEAPIAAECLQAAALDEIFEPAAVDAMPPAFNAIDETGDAHPVAHEQRASMGEWSAEPLADETAWTAAALNEAAFIEPEAVTPVAQSADAEAPAAVAAIDPNQAVISEAEEGEMVAHDAEAVALLYQPAYAWARMEGGAGMAPAGVGVEPHAAFEPEPAIADALDLTPVTATAIARAISEPEAALEASESPAPEGEFDFDDITFVIEDMAVDDTPPPSAPAGRHTWPDAGEAVEPTRLARPDLDVATPASAARQSPQRPSPMQWAREALANVDTVYAAVRAAWARPEPTLVADDPDVQAAEFVVVISAPEADDEVVEPSAGCSTAPVPEFADVPLELDLTEQIEALSLAGYTAFIVQSDGVPDADEAAAAQVVLTVEASEPIEPPQFYEIAITPEPEQESAPEPPAAPPRLRVERPAPRPEPMKPPKRRCAREKPIQDEWGMFDPNQCGFAALVDKLEEVTDDEGHGDLGGTSVRVVSYQ